jgi:hypothetical protein
MKIIAAAKVIEIRTKAKTAREHDTKLTEIT